MRVDEIRFLLGGVGSRNFSDEIARTSRGVAWYDGSFYMFNNYKFYSWNELDFNSAVELFESSGIKFTYLELKSSYFNQKD